MVLPITRPDLGDEEAEAVRRVLESGWVTQGPEVQRFEEEFAALVGAPHAVATSNCTTALHLALLAVGVGPGDEVIAPSHTFVAVANVIVQAGATPVFADVQLDTFNLCPDDVARRVTERTKAIIAVHQLGLPCDLTRLTALAEAHGLALVEDAACAAGAQIQWEGAWEPIGGPRGAVACFSFHPRKILTTGDGGMLTTRDPQIAERCRRMRQHGMTVSDTLRHSSSKVLIPRYEAPGFNYRLTDIQAAVGRVQLKKLPARIARRRELAGQYRQALAQAPELALPREPEWARSNYQSFCVRLTAACPREQQALMQALLEQGISSRPGVHCCHQEPAHSSGPRDDLPASEEASRRGLILPLFAAMTDADVERVATALIQEAQRA